MSSHPANPETTAAPASGSSIPTSSDRELGLHRIINAPREKVYAAWTDPELLKQWFAPMTWSTPRAQLDVRPGGTCLVVMSDPQGNEFPNPGVYLDVLHRAGLPRSRSSDPQ